MSDVFISYAREDQRFVRYLYNILEQNNRSIWVDWEGIPPTAQWLQEIYSAIQSADNFIFVISPDSFLSEACLQEIKYAQVLQKRIIPLLCRNVDESIVIAPIKDLQWIFFRETDNLNLAIQQLIFALDTDLNYWHLSSRFQVRAQEWDNKGRNLSMTLRGRELADAEQWLQEGITKSPRPTQLQVQFISESRRRTNLRQRTTIGGLSIGFIVILILLVVTLVLNQVVSAQNNTLTRQNTVLSAESIAGEARASLANHQIDQGLLFSVAALQRNNEFETRDTLLSSLEYSPFLDTILQNGSSNADGVHYDVAFCRDVKTLMQASNQKVAVWDISQRKEHLHLTSNGPFFAAALSPDCTTVATKDTTGVTFWSAITGVRLFHLAMSNPAGNTSVHGLDFSPDGHYLASADCVDNTCLRGEITLWNISSGTVATRFPVDFPPTRMTLTFSPNGKLLALTECDIYLCANSQFLVWNIASQALIFSSRLSFDTNQGSFATLAFSPDGTTVFLGGCIDARCGVGQILVWDVSTKGFIASIPVDGGEVNVLAFNPTEQTLMVANGQLETSKLRLLNLVTGAFTDFSFLGHSGAILSISFSPDGKYFATTGLDNKVLLWHTAPNTSLSLSSPSLGLYGLSYAVFSPDGKELLTSGELTPHGSIEGIVLRDLKTGRIIAQIAGAKDVLSLAFSPDGRTIAAGQGDGEITLWDVVTHELIGSLAANQNYIRALAFSPDGHYLVSTGFTNPNAQNYVADKTIIWDMTTGKPSHIFTLEGCACGAAFSPNGSMLAVTDRSSNITLWDVFTKGNIASLHNPVGIIDVAISPDGKVLAALDVNGNIILWNIAKQQRFGQLPVNQSSFSSINTSLAFSPDGKLLLSTSGRSVTLWDWATGELYVRPLNDQYDIIKAEFSPDGQYLLTSDNLGPVIVRYATIAGWESQACQIAHRELTFQEWKQFIPNGIPYHAVCAN